MRWDDLRTSQNVEDRRGDGGGGGGGGGRIGFGGGGRLGIGTIVVLGLIGWALGINPAILIGGAEMVTGGNPRTSQYQETQPRSSAPPDDRVGLFVAKVLGETEDVWSQVMPQQVNRRYEPPKLVLFSGYTSSPCGPAQSATGPFYCPNDRKVYLDTSFFQEMQQRFGGGGEFAYAYVIAHEVGHHIENLLGILEDVRAQQVRAGDRSVANNLSVRVELMADCLAGVWANKMNERRSNITEKDVRDAVNAATAIGDDRIQRQTQGRVVPDSFTHGSSEQRVRWLTVGLKSGDMRQCNTFQRSVRL